MHKLLNFLVKNEEPIKIPYSKRLAENKELREPQFPISHFLFFANKGMFGAS